MMRQLLTKEEVKAGYYIKFFETELLRGAAKDRGEYYWKLFQMGALSPNGLLELEDMDGYEGGDIHLVPGNMTTPENAAKATPKPGPMAPANDDSGEDDGGADPARDRLNVGRVLSAANERKIRTANTELSEVLSQLDDQQPEE